MTSQRVLLKYDESETLNMKSNCSLFLKAIISSQHRFNSRSEQLAMMTKQVNSLLLRTGNTLLSKLKCNESTVVNMKSYYSSFLRTDDKINTASFLRCRGVL